MTALVPCHPSESLSLPDFHILTELFRSPTGAVFKTRRKRNRCLCVLKERKFAELGRKRDILNEVALLSSLSHTNVIKCYGNFWDYGSGALYMVLEYADDGDLFQAVAKRRREGGYVGGGERREGGGGGENEKRGEKQDEYYFMNEENDDDD